MVGVVEAEDVRPPADARQSASARRPPRRRIHSGEAADSGRARRATSGYFLDCPGETGGDTESGRPPVEERQSETLSSGAGELLDRIVGRVRGRELESPSVDVHHDAAHAGTLLRDVSGGSPGLTARSRRAVA